MHSGHVLALVSAPLLSTHPTHHVPNLELKTFPPLVVHVISWAADGSPALEGVEIDLGTSVLFEGSAEETNLLLAPFAVYMVPNALLPPLRC